MAVPMARTSLTLGSQPVSSHSSSLSPVTMEKGRASLVQDLGQFCWLQGTHQHLENGQPTPRTQLYKHSSRTVHRDGSPFPTGAPMTLFSITLI